MKFALFGFGIFWIAADRFEHRMLADAGVPIARVADVALVPVQDAVPIAAIGRADRLRDLVAFVEAALPEIERGFHKHCVFARNDLAGSEQFFGGHSIQVRLGQREQLRRSHCVRSKSASNSSRTFWTSS